MVRGLPLLVLLSVIFAAGVARAENVGIEVAVDVASLDPAVTKVGVSCMVCTVDCEVAAGTQVLGTGATTVGLDPLRQGYLGPINVTVPASSAKGTDYLCRLNVANASASFMAGTGPDWTLPDEDQPFTNMLKGKLPSSKVPLAVRCANGGEPINGKCPNAPVASNPPPAVKLCPDGRAMPANGNCGFVGPKIETMPPNVIQLLIPCPNNQQRLADGSCPAAAQAPANKLPAGKLTTQVPCPNGQPRAADGSCPAAPSKFLLKRFILQQPANNGLH